MAEHAHTKKARAKLCDGGYKVGGHITAAVAKGVHAHESHLHPGQKKTPAKRLKDGGKADGEKSHHRADKHARGGKPKSGKSHVTVNVINAHGAPKPPMMMKPPMPMPPPGAGGPPGMPPGGPPPGMGAPSPFKRGGRTKAPKIDSQRDAIGGMPDGHFRKGGKTGSNPYAGSADKPYPIDSGAAGGKARLDKVGLPMKRKSPK